MQIEFTSKQPCDELRIIAETRKEAIDLSRWDNCVLSGKFDYNRDKKKPTVSLLIFKNI